MINKLNILTIMVLIMSGTTDAQTRINDLRIVPNSTFTQVGQIDFAEQNGTHAVSLAAPVTISANVLWHLPNADGSPGSCLNTNGAGNLGWGACSAGALVAPVTISGTISSPILTLTQSGSGKALQTTGDVAVTGRLDVTGSIAATGTTSTITAPGSIASIGTNATMSFADRSNTANYTEFFKNSGVTHIQNGVSGTNTDVITFDAIGQVSVVNNISVGTDFTVSNVGLVKGQAFSTTGSGGLFTAIDQSTGAGNFSTFYRNANVTHITDTTFGDEITYDTAGQITMPGRLNVTGSIANTGSTSTIVSQASISSVGSLASLSTYDQSVSTNFTKFVRNSGTTRIQNGTVSTLTDVITFDTSGLVTIPGGWSVTTNANMSSTGFLNSKSLFVLGTSANNNPLIQVQQSSFSTIAELDGDSGQSRILTVATNGGTGACVSGTCKRWSVGADTAAESSGNVGSSFFIERYNDAGGAIGAPIQIARATGLITFNNDVLFNGNLTGTHAQNLGTSDLPTFFGGTFNSSVTMSGGWTVTTNASMSSTGFLNAKSLNIVGTSANNNPLVQLGQNGFSSIVEIDGDAATSGFSQSRIVTFATNGGTGQCSGGTCKRWSEGADTSLETGSNAGSSWFLERYNDAGGAIGAPIQVARATGLVTFNNGISVSGGCTGCGGVTSAFGGTGISVSPTTGAITITNTGVTSLSASGGVSVSASSGVVSITCPGCSGGISSVSGTSPITASTVSGAVTVACSTCVVSGSTPTFTGVVAGAFSNSGWTFETAGGVGTFSSMRVIFLAGSCAGQPSGQLWNNGGVVNVCP